MEHSRIRKLCSVSGSLSPLGSQSIDFFSAACLGPCAASGLPVQVALLNAEEGSLQTSLEIRSTFPMNLHICFLTLCTQHM